MNDYFGYLMGLAAWRAIARIVFDMLREDGLTESQAQDQMDWLLR